MKKYIVNNSTLTSKKISDEKNIVYISDIHGEVEKIQDIVELIKKMEISTLLLGGDTIDNTKDNDRNNRIKELLQEIAKTTKIIIGIGNHDMIYFDKNSTNRCFEVPETNIPFWQELKETDNIYVSEIPIENATISKLVADDEIDVTSLNLPINHYWNGEPEEEFEDYIKMIEDLSINTEKFNILLCHSPKNIGKDTIIKEYYDILKNFNLILSGHMHSGLIPRWLRTKPYGKGLAGPYNTIFPEYAYGTKNFDDTTILTTGGVTKLAQSVGPEVITTNYLFRELVNLVYPPEVELLKIEGKEKILQYK